MSTQRSTVVIYTLADAPFSRFFKLNAQLASKEADLKPVSEEQMQLLDEPLRTFVLEISKIRGVSMLLLGAYGFVVRKRRSASWCGVEAEILEALKVFLGVNELVISHDSLSQR